MKKFTPKYLVTKKSAIHVRTDSKPRNWKQNTIIHKQSEIRLVGKDLAYAIHPKFFPGGLYKVRHVSGWTARADTLCGIYQQIYEHKRQTKRNHHGRQFLQTVR